MTPEELVLEVFVRARAHDARVADLYAPDATLTFSFGTIRGREAIADFYRKNFAEGVDPEVTALYANPPLVVTVNKAYLSGNKIDVVDVFEVAGDFVRSMHACRMVTTPTGNG
jgi:hypothetical protein